MEDNTTQQETTLHTFMVPSHYRKLQVNDVIDEDEYVFGDPDTKIIMDESRRIIQIVGGTAYATFIE